jgi:hypothetical protein
MKTSYKYILSIAGLTAALTLSAKATFVIEPQPIAEPKIFEKFFNDKANKNVTSFTGTVGGHKFGTDVTVTTTGKVNTGAGWANIVPVKSDTLTDLIFTPADPTRFEDFSFRGQITSPGFVSIRVTDSAGMTFTFVSPFLSKDFDFGRIGVISNDGETIASVEVFTTSDTFKEIKQVAFSFAGTPPPVPDGGATVMLLGAALSVLGMARRYLKS